MCVCKFCVVGVGANMGGQKLFLVESSYTEIFSGEMSVFLQEGDTLSFVSIFENHVSTSFLVSTLGTNFWSVCRLTLSDSKPLFPVAS